jgi:hypothetical protein
MKVDIAEGMRALLVETSTTLGWWAKNHDQYDGLLDKLVNAGFQVSLSNSGIDISGSGDKAMLILAFKLLRAEGYTPSRRPEAKDTYFSTYMRHDDLDRRSIWFTFSSTVCKRVQVGTEMKEVAVYEVQCGEPMTITDEELA